MLVSLLATTIVSATLEDDDCINCQEKSPNQQLYHKLYCKIFDIRESDLYKKVTLKVETRAHPSSDLETVVFYNTSVDLMQDLYNNQKPADGDGKGWGHWVNIYYTIDAKGLCHIVIVDTSGIAPGEIAIDGMGLFWLFIVVAMCGFFVGIFLAP